MATTKGLDYRDQLQAIVEKESKKRAISMNSIAGIMGVSPAQLSSVLSKHKHFSLPLLERAVRKIGHRVSIERF